MTKEEYRKELEWSTFRPNLTNSVKLQCWKTGFTVEVSDERSEFKNREKALELYYAHLEEYLKNEKIED